MSWGKNMTRDERTYVIEIINMLPLPAQIQHQKLSILIRNSAHYFFDDFDDCFGGGGKYI